MALERDYICKKCRYVFPSLTGVGYFFIHQGNSVVEAVKEGKYGEKWKDFLLSHPEGTVNCKSELLICKDCGAPKNDFNLTLYLPKRDVNEDDLRIDQFVSEKRSGDSVYATFPHTCDVCGGECVISKVIPSIPMKCPKCHGEMKAAKDNSICFD